VYPTIGNASFAISKFEKSGEGTGRKSFLASTNFTGAEKEF
jgi:hypothetical protein